MYQQYNLFEGERQKEKGMALANGAARVQRWKEKARYYFDKLNVGSELTSDVILCLCGTPAEGANQNNVVGAWISGLSKSGRIRFTGQFKKSSRVSRHAGLQRVWRKVK